MEERLQKIIAASGLCSRRAAEEMIEAGRVTVNGESAALGMKADARRDSILVDGKKLPSGEKKLYLLYYKPRGIVTSLKDEKGRKDISLLLEELGTRVYPVGRLDLDSEGLLLLTNDGDFANRLSHPSFEVDKCYRTWLRGEGIEEKIPLLREPMEIDGYAIRPAQVELLRLGEGEAVAEITIHEGRNRQVRKMCARVGLEVTRLMRVREGFLRLGKLRPGQWRELSPEEVSRLYGE